MTFVPYISYAAGDFKGVCTEQDLIKLTNDGTNTGEVNLTILAAAIEDIQELIDGKLRRITDVPLGTPPRTIKALAAGLVVDALRLRHSKVRDMDQQALYKNMLTQLEEIASGKIVLEIGTSGSAASASMVFEPGTRSFNDDAGEETYDEMMKG